MTQQSLFPVGDYGDGEDYAQGTICRDAQRMYHDVRRLDQDRNDLAYRYADALIARDEATQKKILVDNPARLYGFDD